ncbi:hypothetical protein HKA89_16715 [Vibrio parahaemolyticus]|uniref:hypothetical protein n=1 Tax=Vibrio parahaemolyticus TaxID=670 RepID=UPI00146E9063|nr:hypothetical protein [Vibrio parahaemolyticus]MDF5278873.1 hypothetical protein [Vibrio parahaemolyticus]NMU70402.1 hypothetical protein [Vibrio parahaemolyticus]
MNDICAKLAKLESGVLGEPLGVDELMLAAVHQRAYMEALNAIDESDIKSSYLLQMLTVGATYSIVMSLMKSYDRQTRKEEINTLRKLFLVSAKSDMAEQLFSEYDTENLNSVFVPLKNYRDKTLAHNESKELLSWEQVDQALMVSVTAWSYVETKSESRIMFPFHSFSTVSSGLERLFSCEDLSLAKRAWDNYIANVMVAYEAGKCL